MDGQVLARKDISGPDHVRQFVKEIRALGDLRNSRFIIHLDGVVLSQDGKRVKGFLMPLCEGGTLDDVIYDNAGSLPWSQRLKWGYQIVNALLQIHETGIVHGNLNLSKIALDDNDDINIFGFGSLEIDTGWEPPETEQFIQHGGGLRMYQSPKSDIYQLGMVLWALASQVYDPESSAKPLQLTEEMETSEWYKFIVELCLSPNPRLRPYATTLLLLWKRSELSDSLSGRMPGAGSTAFGSSPSSMLGDSNDDDLFDTSSIKSIDTSVSANSTNSAIVKDATDSFVDLLDESMNLTSVVQKALEQKKLDPNALRNGVRRLLKLFSRDLSSELPSPEYRDACNFFMSSSRQISYEIAARAGIKMPSDVEKISPKEIETGTSRTSRERNKIIQVFDDESDAEEEEGPVSEDDAGVHPRISVLREVIASSEAFQLFMSNVYTLIHPSFESRLKRVSQVVAEKGAEIDPDGSLAEIVAELLYSQPSTITLSDTNSMSWIDAGKCWVENYTQQNWEWWPLMPTQARVPTGKAKLLWRCVSLQRTSY